MCGRYTMSERDWELQQRYAIYETRIPPRISFNITPGQTSAVVLTHEGNRTLTAMRWGLVPSWAQELPRVQPSNARSETVLEKPYFRKIIRQQRCIVPASGFFEWQHGAGGRVPMYIHPANDTGWALAGMWDRWNPTPDGPALETFTLLTVPPNEAMATIHDRMPVILSKTDWHHWLDGATPLDEVMNMLRPCPAGLITMHTVSSRVNKAGVDGPELIERVVPMRGLFDR